ncbi:coiled-coil domain-containing protein 153 isoform X1 [Podarcis raffonei]|uniref:coiled-coil domain-containing protein 153 isoform X1 n=2 Tax=Podarcis raffonei TaxID=65483 RepID=UPI0023298D6E|nr:coiled-coil domain-containing protein 153 isoform X1 [Podarcis raffonei]
MYASCIRMALRNLPISTSFKIFFERQELECTKNIMFVHLLPFAGCGERARMAPTKKGKGKKSAKQKKNTGPDEEKYRKAVLEVDTLKQYLVLRRDMARQAMADSEGLKQMLLDLEKELEEARGDKKDIYEEMIRKYQQLQHQTDTRIHCLEAETQNLQAQLAACQGDLLQSQLDQARMLEEKDKAVAEMQRKVDEMETEYEKILHGSLDCVLSKLQSAKLTWEKEATVIHMDYKHQLKDFGLNPLYI